MTKSLAIALTAIKLLPLSGNREYVIVKNAGPDPAYLEIGDESAGVTPARGIKIAADESIFFITRDMASVAREEMHIVSDGASDITVMFK